MVSRKAVEEIVLVLRQELSLDQARRIADKLRNIPASQSFQLTMNMIYLQLDRDLSGLKKKIELVKKRQPV